MPAMSRPFLCCFAALLMLACLPVPRACGQGQPANGLVPMGCYPDGKVFTAFTPDAVPVRTVAYLTPFGTLNANIVVGQEPSGLVTTGAMELTERLGEYLAVINTSSVDPIGLTASQVPAKYLEEKTMILCGGPKENPLVRQLVDTGKSRVAWDKEATGMVEVVPNAFGGPGAAVILAGATPEASYTAIGALAQFFKHLSGAGLVEAAMLKADRELQRDDLTSAAESVRTMLNGLRIDGSTHFYAPLKKTTEHFGKMLEEEVNATRKFSKLLETKPTPEQANAEFQKIAVMCADCHRDYLSYNRMGTNRVQFLYSQYPKTRLETKWAQKD